jgi:hypothetical protein
VDGDGKRDIVAPAFVDSTGKLLFYRSDSSGGFRARVEVEVPEIQTDLR